MDLLFNKAENGIIELREHLSHLYASNEFQGIAPELRTATTEVVKITSPDVYRVALIHYKSANYQKESPTEAEENLDQLVFHLREPIALQAYLHWAPVHDLVHDTSGRRQRIDEHSRNAYQWQTDAEENKIRQRLGLALDALITFLDDNKAQFTDWPASHQYKILKANFVNTVEAWEAIHPIGTSRHTLQLLAPFATQVQQSEIEPTLSRPVYTTIINKLKADTALTETEAELIKRSHAPIVLMAMAIALERLPVSVLPDALHQLYYSDSSTTRSSQVPNANDRASAIIALRNQGKAELAKLQQYIQQQDAVKNGLPFNLQPTSYAGKKFFRT